MPSVARRTGLSGNDEGSDRKDRQARVAFLFFAFVLLAALVIFVALPFLG